MRKYHSDEERHAAVREQRREKTRRERVARHARGLKKHRIEDVYRGGTKFRLQRTRGKTFSISCKRVTEALR